MRPSRPIASIALFAALSGCGGGQQPAPAAPAMVTTPAPAESEEAAESPSAEDAGPGPQEAPESASDCEAYLALYQRCEPVLEPEIMAGNRRSYRAERAFIDYLKTTPEGAGVEQNCAELLRALRPICGA